MTGELFEVISKYSILKHSINEKKINIKIFKNRVIKSQKSNFNLFDCLFEFRSRTLLSNKKFHPKSEIFGYLIGNEIKSNFESIRNNEVIIIGSSNNSKLYSYALSTLKIKNTIINSKNITVAGLSMLFKNFLNYEKK